MPRRIVAKYENGFLKPLEKVELKEHQEVEIIIRDKESMAKKSQGIMNADPEIIEDVALNPEYSSLE